MGNIELGPIKTFNLRGRLYTLEGPAVMGILNITPDSFYRASRVPDVNHALAKVEAMLNHGATFIDIGGYSSRPGAEDISVDEELLRVIPVIEKVVEKFPGALVSIDTFRSKVAKEAVGAGAVMVNDISGGTLDGSMYSTVGKLNVPYILMHMKGTPQTMKALTDYDNILNELLDYFWVKVVKLREMGCKDIIIDPGFGFAKTMAQNYYLLGHLEKFNILNLPILVGLSRKSMIYKKLNISSEGALNGTTVLNTVAVKNGASILRVHDVKEAVEVINLLNDLH